VFAPGLQAPDWHRSAVAGVQPDEPSARPQRPPSHAFTSHWLGAAQAPPTAAPQVFVVALQRPLAQTMAATPVAQTPLRSPSLGIGVPSARSARHVSVDRSQYWSPPQSESAQQPAPPAGTQRPLAEHAFVTHCTPAVQAAPSAKPQLLAAALQRPVVHAAFWPLAAHAS
jgi:hypothetical protein